VRPSMDKLATWTALGLALAGGATRAARADTEADPYAGIAVEQLYDSNVENSHGADAVTRVTPRLGFLVLGPRVDLDAAYRLGIHTYADGSAPNSINHRASIVGRAAATPRLDVDTRLILVAGADPILLDRPGIAIPQGPFVDFEGHAGAKYQAERRL